MSYEWLKALHMIAVISWMAGLLYLPRLYVYHADATPGGEHAERLKVMERRLLRFIMTPALIASFLFGVWMLADNPALLEAPFMQVKLGLVAGLAALHGFLARARRLFAADANRHSARFWRILNEVPTALMIGIVILVVVKPW